jgi:amino acid adenylation domain-containing protein
LELQSLEPWFARHGDEHPQLVNMYGITETTVHVTYRPLKAADLTETTGSVIGSAIPDLEVLVMDAQQRWLPAGVAGELFVAGEGLARGYLNRPDLAAERFLPHPYSKTPGARLYRTGDLARFTGKGELVYLGRIDHQVKIRGFRIELGEVETALDQHPVILESVVLAKEDEDGQNRLIAFLVGDGQAVTSADLRTYLSEKLPEYMIPATFIVTEKLPLTAHGKVDRRALLALDQTPAEKRETNVGPSTPVEEVLAAVWAQALALELVGVNEDFFELGGDSIRSIQMIALARERGLNFTVQQLFEHRNIRNLAQVLKFAGSSTHSAAPTAPFSLVAEDDRARLPEGVEDAYPLAMLQAGMLFHSAFNPDSAVYHDIFTFYLRAPLDIEHFRSAAQHLVARHPLLRTSFDLSTYSEPLQMVHRTVEVPVVLDDIQHLSVDEQWEALMVWGEDEKRRPFDWMQAPLLRFQLHRRSPQTFQFTMSFHHALMDGWSVATMLTELFQIYLALVSGAKLSREIPAAAFRDYVAAEREALSSDEARRYWHEKLSDHKVAALPRFASLPEDAGESQAGERDVEISAELSNALKKLSQLAAIPLKSVLLAAHLRAISLLSGQVDVLTGVVSHGRPEITDGEKVIGLFLNTLPFRQQLSGGTWLELVQETFASEQEMYSYRRYPLAQLQKEIGGGVLFETAFNYLHFHVYEGIETTDEVEIIERGGFEQTNFTLSATFNVDTQASQLRLSLAYDAAVISGQQADAVASYYKRILEAMASSPADRYDSQSFLSEQELHQLLTEWNATTRDYAGDKCLHELFEAQARNTPDMCALFAEEQQLTYEELNRRANQLAHYLKEQGVGPEVLVGLMVERGIEMVVGLLGVLKAGGAYLPLDPEYPRERLSFMMEDSGMSVLLTQERLQERVTEHRAKVICIDSEWKQKIAAEREDNPSGGAGSRNAAYVIYTSGSTGKPKGTLIEHYGVCNLSVAQQDCFQVEAGERVLQVASISFDASIFEIVMALLSGATLYLSSPDTMLAGATMANVLRENSITNLTISPSTLSTVPFEELQQLRTVIVAGEACPSKLAQVWSAGRRFFNAYGPTEVTVWASVAQCFDNDRKPSIGRPIANKQLYILNEKLGPVPVGVMGQLHIGGVGLARCYLNRPELTADRFIPDPFTRQAGARIYKTGDLARFLPDGNIDYVGRIDQQVKLRGYRIEVQEIEQILLQHPDVREVIVLAHTGSELDSRLIAYVVGGGEAATINKLRINARDQLPEYMIPSHFVLLDEMPLTPNGKVDRRKLSALEPGAVKSHLNHVEPRTTFEKKLARLWAEVLKVSQVSVHDNFFEVGGHSLLAMKLTSRIREEFGLELPVRRLFEIRTIAGLAEVLSETQAENEAGPPASEIKKITAVGRGESDLSQLLVDFDRMTVKEIEALVASEA